MAFLKLRDKEKKIFLLLTILFLFYVFPIILADRYYNDDLSRALIGATGWNGDGRPLAEIIMLFMCGGMPVVDISPLPLIMGIILLAYVLALYAQKNLYEYEQIFPKVCGLFLVITNPFLLANLSYKFDVLGMLVALCAVIVCYVLPENIKSWKLFLADIILCLMALSLYQAVIGAYLALFFIDLYFKHEKNIYWKKEALKLAVLAVSGVFYKMIIADVFVSKEDWRAEASQYISEFSMQSAKTIWNNFYNLCSVIVDDFSGIPVFIILLLIAVLIYIVCEIVKMWEAQSSKKIFWSFYILFLPVGTFLSCILPLILLKSLGVASRILIPLSVCMLLVGIILLSLYQKIRIIISIVFIICMISSYSYSYAYGNALEGQKNYEIYMGMNIVRDVERINVRQEYTKLTLDGNMPRAQQVEMMCQKYPQFDEIIPVYITNDSWRGGAWLYYYMQQNLMYEEMQEDDLEVVKTEEPIEENQVYSCYVNKDKIIIHFNCNG